MAAIKRKEKKNGEIVYRITISVGKNPETGKWNPKVITFKPDQNATPKQQEKEARKYAMEWEDKLKNGESYEGEELTFSQYAEKWLAYKKADVAFSTFSTYSYIVDKKLLPYFANYKIARIKTPLIETFYRTLLGDNSNGTMQKIRNVLSEMFSTAVRWQMIQMNPCKEAKLPKNKDEHTELQFFTPEQSIMFLRSLDMSFNTTVKGHERIDDTGIPYLVGEYTEERKLPTQLQVFFTLSLYCGLRKGETLALCWSDIDFEKREIRIEKATGKTEAGFDVKMPKTKTSIRTIIFPKVILPILKQYKREYTWTRLHIGTAWQGTDNLFIQDDGKRMGYSTPYQAFRRHLRRYNDWVMENPVAAKKQGFEALPVIPLHGLRHSCATLLNYLDVNIIDISKILGHAKSSTTMNIYAHSFEEQNKEAARKLDQFASDNLRKQA